MGKEIYISCENCIHGYFNGTRYICSDARSEYYGMGLTSVNMKECKQYEEKKKEGKRLFYGQG